MRKRIDALLAPGLQVDVAGALVEGVVSTATRPPAPRPGRWRRAACCCCPVPPAARSWRRRNWRRPLRRPHRLGQGEEFGRVAMDILRIGHHPAHRALGLALDLVDPVGEVGLGRRHHHLAGGHLHRQHPVPLGIAGAHGIGHLAHVHLERVDAQIGQPGAARHPLGKRLDVQRLAVAGRAPSPLRPAAPADAGRSRPGRSAPPCAAPPRRK